METLIPNLTIAAMATSALIGIAIPVALYTIFRKKGANHLPFWIGCITFVLFVFVLEKNAFYLFMSSQVGQQIWSNTVLLAIVGGSFAGVFEEVGRYIAFKTVLRKKRANDYNGLMYGAGHGGVEAVILLSAPLISNIIFSLQHNAGQTSVLGGPDLAQQLMNTPFWMMFVGAVERMIAVTIHVSFSVMVWFAAKNSKKFWLFPLAILLHTAVDALAVILSSSGMNVWLIEGVVFVMAIMSVLLAVAVWKKNHTAAETATVAELAPNVEA